MTGADLTPHAIERPARRMRAASTLPSIAVLTAVTPGIAIAACTFAWPTLGDSPLVEIQLTPPACSGRETAAK